MGKKRIAIIDRDLCIEERCGYVCMKVCPPNRMGEECVTIEKETKFPVISEELCIGCGICPKKCPMDCITIINLEKELEEQIYQYGINTFRLHGLPLPQDGAVALVGKNGIGKTTALQLLSNNLKPNFGIFDRKLSEEEVMAKLPIEIKRYYSAVGNDSLKISHKPQNIDKIRAVFNGEVRKLIESACGKGAVEKAETIFGLEKIMKRKISHLSGGELQKVAIAVAYLKDADIYYIDEFTNFLDIEERLKIGVILKELSEKKRLILAEHDLTILDYVSTYVYLFYGEENSYGVVSLIKNVRAGINEYLEGFLKDENIRFRDYELSFKTHGENELKTPVRFKYDKMEKKFEEFSFSSDSGEIREGEIVGMVGKNALGKSLLIKLLAGIEKPDGSPNQFKSKNNTPVADIKVSYKPQYIHAEDFVVQEMFNAEKISMSIFEECKRRLKITTLLEKKLTELSGGELQRIALTLALSREADIYLFDEPSAFLDIEQRYEFAHLLKNVINETNKCAFVVDHDIVFIDNVASRLVVFSGESSVTGKASAALNKKDGMNGFLKVTGVTMRRDKNSKRPRVNKPGSVLDNEQKKSGEYYYS